MAKRRFDNDTPYSAMFSDISRGVDPNVAHDIGHPVPEHLLGEEEAVTDELGSVESAHWPTAEQRKIGKAAIQALRQQYPKNPDL